MATNNKNKLRETRDILSPLGIEVISLSDAGIDVDPDETGETFEYYTDRVPTSYHGTGDIFSSVVVGALTRGKTLSDAFRIACDYTKETIEYTYKTPGTNAYGVDFEVTLPKLVERINN